MSMGGSQETGMRARYSSLAVVVALGLCLEGSTLARAGEPAAATDGQLKPARVRETVVTATRRDTLLSEAPSVIQLVTRQEIEELNPSSTGKLLEYVTGVTVESGTGSALPKRSVVGLNGLPANYTLVLVDGVRLLSEHIHTGTSV